MANKPTNKELEQRVKKLQEEKERYYDTITNLNEGFYSVSLDGVLLDYNIKFKKILGLDPDKEIEGLKLLNFWHWQKQEDRKTYVDMLMKNGFVRDYELHAKKVTGEKIMIQTNSRLIRDKQGRPSRIEGSFLDITNRKKAEEALMKREERIFLAMEATKDGLWDWNITTGEAYFSPEYFSKRKGTGKLYLINEEL